MELEKEKSENIELSSQEEYAQKLLERFNTLKDEIENNNNSHKQKLSSKIYDIIHSISIGGFLLSSLILSICIPMLIRFLMGDFTDSIIDILFKMANISLILITFSIFIYNISVPTIFDNKDTTYDKSFLGNIKNKIKNKFFKQLFSKNIPLLTEKNDIENKFNYQFDESFINNIYYFYENNQYLFGSDEHFKLAQNFNRVRHLRKRNDYINMFSQYIKDKYEYYGNIPETRLSYKL